MNLFDIFIYETLLRLAACQFKVLLIGLLFPSTDFL